MLQGNPSPLKFEDVDLLLDELASLSGYSHSSVREKRDKSRTRMSILKDIYLTMSPSEAKFMTQIILKDLRPVLYPIEETNTTRALLHHKSNETHYLTKWEVMHAWHPSMPTIYRLRATLDAASRAFENDESQCNMYQPVLGIPVEVRSKSLYYGLQPKYNADSKKPERSKYISRFTIF